MRQIEPRPVQYIAGKVQAEYGQAMGQLLDRMSSNLFEYAGKLRSEEGLKWAAENQITEQQLEDMVGGKPEDAVNIGAGTIIEQGNVKKSLASLIPSKFNEAVIKFRSAELSYKLEQKAISEMSKMLEDIDRGPSSGVSSKNIIQKLNTITNAHYEVLTGVDPAAANRYNATVATHGNAVYKAALKSEAEYNKRERTTEFYKTLDEENKILDRQIQENPQVIDFIYDAGYARLKQTVLHEGIGFEMGRKYLDEYSKKFINGKVNFLSKHFMSGSTDDVFETLSKIQKGDAGNYSSLLKGMDVDSVAKITANVMTAYTQREQVKTNNRAEKERNATAASIDLLEKIFTFKNKNDPTRIAYVEQLLALPPGSTPIGTLKDVLEPEKAAEGNANTAYNAYNAIQKNIIKNIEDLDKISGLSPEQRLALAKEFYKKDKEDSRILTRTINELSGLPTDENVYVNLNPDSSQFKSKVKLEADAERIRSEAEAKGQILKGSQIANLLKQEVIARRSSIEAKQAQESLDNYAIGRDGKPKKGREWIPGPVNKNTLGALREVAKKIKDPEERRRAANQILEIESLIEKAEGNK